MITMHLRAADLAETSFAVSPLQETVLSLWVWQHPELQPFHLPWRHRMLPVWQACDTEMLEAVVAPDTGWVPDFLTPRPPGPYTEFDAELRHVAATPWRTVRADLDIAYDGRQPLPVLQARPSEVRRRIVTALADYHRRCIAPSWPRIRAVLDGDIAYRARRLADAGARGLFSDLDPRVRWDDGRLIVDQGRNLRYDLEVEGRGLPLVPSLFALHALTYISDGGPPLLIYPARGRAAIWETAVPPPTAALAGLLGGPRAQLLTLLREPASTTELAARLGVTPQRGQSTSRRAARRPSGHPRPQRPHRAVPAE